jgi:hypothetical protein
MPATSDANSNAINACNRHQLMATIIKMTLTARTTKGHHQAELIESNEIAANDREESMFMVKV